MLIFQVSQIFSPRFLESIRYVLVYTLDSIPTHRRLHKDTSPMVLLVNVVEEFCQPPTRTYVLFGFN